MLKKSSIETFKKIRLLIKDAEKYPNIVEKIHQIFADKSKEFLDSVLKTHFLKPNFRVNNKFYMPILHKAAKEGILEVIIAISNIYLRHIYFSSLTCKENSKTQNFTNLLFHQEIDASKIKSSLTNEILNSKSSLGDTILHVAIYYGRAHIITWLIENGADVNAVNAFNKTPLLYAAFVDEDEIFPYLLDKLHKKIDLDAQNDRGVTILHNMVNNDKPELVKKILNLGANINLQNSYRNDALSLAAHDGNLAIVEILLKYAAEKNIRLINIKRAILMTRVSPVGERNLRIAKIVELLEATLKSYEIEDAKSVGSVPLTHVASASPKTAFRG